MQIKSIQLQSYETLLTNEKVRHGVFVEVIDLQGNSGWGEIAPLPQWSKETLKEAVLQLQQMIEKIKAIDWNMNSIFQELSRLKLYPSVLFGLESALLILLNPSQTCCIQTSALLMGSKQEILEKSHLVLDQGFTFAKLKISQLSFSDASEIIHLLKDKFQLRIDVNKALTTNEASKFFSQFSPNAFDYVEEPFQNALELFQFTHPLAVDESFPNHLTLEQLEKIPALKAVIYKPMIQGGITNCLALEKWTKLNNITLILSSSFESDIGLGHIALMADRMGLKSPIGIGTYSYLTETFAKDSVIFKDFNVLISTKMKPSTT